MTVASSSSHGFDSRTPVPKDERPWSDCWPDSVNSVENVEMLDEAARKNAPGIVFREVAVLLGVVLAFIVAIEVTLNVLQIH